MTQGDLFPPPKVDESSTYFCKQPKRPFSRSFKFSTFLKKNSQTNFNIFCSKNDIDLKICENILEVYRNKLINFHSNSLNGCCSVAYWRLRQVQFLAHIISSETNDYQSFHFCTIIFIFHTKIANFTTMILMSKFSSLLRS